MSSTTSGDAASLGSDGRSAEVARCLLFFQIKKAMPP